MKYAIRHSPYAIRHIYMPLFTMFAIIRHAPYAIRHVCAPFRHVCHVRHSPFAIFAINGEYLPYMPFCHDGVWRMAYFVLAYGGWRMADGVLYAIRWRMAKWRIYAIICQKLCHMPYAILASAEPWYRVAMLPHVPGHSHEFLNKSHCPPEACFLGLNRLVVHVLYALEAFGVSP
jgi:hypothetical protein